MTTSTTPVEAGIEPPPWAADRTSGPDGTWYSRQVGTFRAQDALRGDIEQVVCLDRWDAFEDGVQRQGEPHVVLTCHPDNPLSPGAARELAALLVEAADLAEQS